MQTAKEKASNAAASAKAGMEKTKATVQEKVDKMKADKVMAERCKEEHKDVAETNKQIQKEDNAEARAASQTGEHHATAGYGSRGTATRTPVAGEKIISGNTPGEHETGGRFD